MSVEIHHTLEGPDDAAVLVFSNSLGTTGVMWDAQAAALSDRFRVLRYDARGHGSTPATRGPYTMGDLAGDVLDLIDRLELERVSFCGLSIGGMTGMWLGVNAPERIDRLAICCTGLQLPPARDVDGARGARYGRREWAAWSTRPSSAGSRRGSGSAAPRWSAGSARSS